MAVFMTACQKEKIENAPTEVDLTAQIQKDYEAYTATYGEVKIEHASLEELNQVFVENGQSPVTLEEIGVTEEEYIAAQERIKNLDGVESRCNPFYRFLIDYNGNGIGNTLDVFLVNKVILGIDPPSIRSINFGYISFAWQNQGIELSTFDRALAVKMVLGIITC